MMSRKTNRIAPGRNRYAVWATNVKVLRNLLGMKTQQELADRLGVKQSTVSDWERAEYCPGPALAIEIGNLAAQKSKGAPKLSKLSKWFFDQAGVDDRGPRKLSGDMERAMDQRTKGALPGWLGEGPARTFDRTFSDFALAEKNEVLLDESKTDLHSLDDHFVLVQWVPKEPGSQPNYLMGWLRVSLEPHTSNQITANLWPARSGEGTLRMILGSWLKGKTVDRPTLYEPKPPSDEDAKRGLKLKQEAWLNLRLDPGFRILGEIIAWRGKNAEKDENKS